MKKILAVDNHPVTLKFITQLLGKRGHQVLTAPDGISALEVLKTNTPDIIFIDLVMPNISGEKLCRIIRKIPKFKDVFIVIISAIAAEEKVNIADFGADACIAKGPFNKMAEYILAIVDNMDAGHAGVLQNKIIGKEDIFQREITKELLLYNRHFEIILDNISEGILEINLQGKIIYANPVANLLTGCREEKLLGSYFIELFNPFHQTRIKELMDLIDEGPQKIPEKRPVELNDKQVALNLLPVKDGEQQTIVVILSDISERKRMEAQLQRSQKMEAIGTLAGGVAHDLNNILSGIVSYPELLLMDLPPESPFRKPILTIQKTGEKAAAIVQDLLTMARRGVPVKQLIDFNHIINEYLDSPEHIKILSFHPGVNVATRFEANLLPVSGSPVHLSKSIMNLFSNAVEAMPEGGTISISTENRYIDSPVSGYDDVEEGDYAVITISDSGVGISEEDMERIFEPFYTKKVMGRSGTGLGMAVVWGTTKDHNGYIDVKSTEGRGTKITLYFPATRKKRVPEEILPAIEDYKGHGESILVVDDIVEQREIASEILKRLGYFVRSVSSGEEAVEYVKNNSTDLILLDMVMDPGIDGLETYKRITELYPMQKAIIASGFSETDRVTEVQKLGGGAYVKKPYLFEKIGMAVRNELAK